MIVALKLRLDTMDNITGVFALKKSYLNKRRQSRVRKTSAAKVQEHVIYTNPVML
jgi:hypothetical protein